MWTRYLQRLTLGVKEETPRQPDYTTHEFRGLAGFKIEEGCATGQSSELLQRYGMMLLPIWDDVLSSTDSPPSICS